jgi:hypothetical protein
MCISEAPEQKPDLCEISDNEQTVCVRQSVTCPSDFANGCTRSVIFLPLSFALEGEKEKK